MKRGAGSTAGLLAAGAVIGVLGFGAVRLAAMPPVPHVHYHANWAVFVDGQRLDLSAPRYMEDVARCKADATKLEPQDRVHLHSGDDDVVHVHAAGATWGHLLANLGFGVGDDYLLTDRGQRYAAAPGRTLKFIVDGHEVTSIRNLLIEDQDRLLVSYGPETAAEVVRTQFPQVATTAAEHNTRPDPATCSGDAHEGFGDRLRRAFWF